MLSPGEIDGGALGELGAEDLGGAVRQRHHHGRAELHLHAELLLLIQVMRRGGGHGGGRSGTTTRRLGRFARGGWAPVQATVRARDHDHARGVRENSPRRRRERIARRRVTAGETQRRGTRARTRPEGAEAPSRLACPKTERASGDAKPSLATGMG